jgi:spore maturation protein CgeB
VSQGPSASSLLASASALRRAMGYRKFVSERITVVLLDGNYHLGSECRSALERLGHRVVSVAVTTPVSEFVRALLLTCAQVRPDFILSINHIGFDEQGEIGSLLDELELPVSVWCVDSPQFILKGGVLPAARTSSLFVWERTLVEAMRARGATDVHYLPLATDPRRFRPADAEVAYPVSFVGDSMEHSQKKWRSRLRAPERAHARRLADEILNASTVEAHCELLEPMALNATAWDVIAAAVWDATGRYRLRLLQSIAGPALHLFGDKGWTRLLPTARYRGPVNYGEDLCQVYRASAISVNATSRQMPTAVNQRVFDVPASGGFLLTDAQCDVGEHFELGTEVVCYRGADELAQLAAEYSRRTDERRFIAQRARARIIRCHTYEHRLTSMVSFLRARHRGSAPVSVATG